jgi:hypothetical protein
VKIGEINEINVNFKKINVEDFVSRNGRIGLDRRKGACLIAPHQTPKYLMWAAEVEKMITIVKQETEETQETPETHEKMITIKTQETPLQETKETPLQETKETPLQPPATVFISKPQVSFQNWHSAANKRN